MDRGSPRSGLDLVEFGDMTVKQRLKSMTRLPKTPVLLFSELEFILFISGLNEA